MSATPISDAIESLANAWNSEKCEEFFRLVDSATIGIRAVDVPPELVGRTISHSPPGITLGSTSHGGRSRVLAFADPKEYTEKFGGQCNGEMSGSELFRVVLHNPHCGGVLLNSALREVSFPLEREDIERFVQTENSKRKSWWRKWV